MEALQGDYWQYTDTKEYETEKDAEKALEDEEGPDDIYKDPKTKEEEKGSDESDYDETSASDENNNEKGPEHPDHPTPPKPPKNAPKKVWSDWKMQQVAWQLWTWQTKLKMLRKTQKMH